MAVLVGEDGHCAQIVALDSNDGRIMWRSPIPRASRAFGHEVSVGDQTAVVTGECAGFTRFRVADGSVAGSVPGDNEERRCATAASDGERIVLASAGRLTVFDADDGKRLRRWEAEALARLGDVLTTDPGVVTARYSSRAGLLDLSSEQPRPFGLDRGWFGGEVPASFRLGDTLWVQYDKEDGVVGYDLETLRERTLRIGFDSDLVGTFDGSLVIATSGNKISLIDPSSSAEERVGVLPEPVRRDGPLAATRVVGEMYVRVWPGQVDSFDLTDLLVAGLPSVDQPRE